MKLWVAGILMVAAVGLWIALGLRHPVKAVTPPAVTNDITSAALPELGAVITPLPEGAGKATAERACLVCHSSDMLRQQRLTEKQWTGELTKMSGWGAELSDSDRAALLPYLMIQFGPENDRFVPVPVRPVGK
jgi:mono/diheme cytochrome c family protein